MGQGYKDLIVWQRGMALAKAVYLATRNFPKEEVFGLTSQMRRAAVSIPSNIAEGRGRNQPGEFLQFLGQARGSLFELETQITLSRDLEYIPPALADELLVQIEEVSRPLAGLRRSVREDKESS